MALQMITPDQPTVSVLMIVKNEEANIEAAMRSVEGLASEICVCDTGSTDRTVEIAERLGARVIHFTYEGTFSFADARNHVMPYARGKWILFVDGDEYIQDGTNFAETLHNLREITDPPVAMVRNMLQLPGGKSMTFFTPRLFLREANIRYVYPVHEQPDYPGDSMNSNIILEHTGYADPEQLQRKERRNLALAKTMPPDHPHGLHSRARSALALEDWPEVIEAAEALIQLDSSPLLTIEGCVLGGMAAYNMQQLDAAEAYVAKGKALADHSSDIRYLELLCVSQRYLETFDAGDSTEPGDFARPWLMWHDKSRVILMMKVLSGAVRISMDPKGQQLQVTSLDGETGEDK